MAEITAKLVGELRQKTGAGMMDCKKALKENDGNIEQSTEWLRKKGLAAADKKAGKTAAEGMVESYIHTGNRVGVLVEVNCQTDFVARNEAFKKLVQDIAKQIVASTQVEYVRVSDIPSDIVEKEKAIEMGKDDLGGKPEAIKEKIVQGRIDKRLKEMCLLDQSYIRDSSITVDELVKQHVAQLGENIQVRRFARFVLGEGIEREETDFAAEVAAQIGTSASTSAVPSEPEAAAEPETPEIAVAKAAEPEAAAALLVLARLAGLSITVAKAAEPEAPAPETVAPAKQGKKGKK